MPRPNTGTAGLRRTLQEQLLLGKRMVALAEDMTDALVAYRAEQVSALAAEQRRCLEQQTALETARQWGMRELAWAAGLERTPTLAELLPTLSVREQETFARLREQLLDVHRQLERINNRNRLLLENALDYVRFSLNALTTAVLQPARYGTNLAQIAVPAFYIDSKA